MDVCDWQTCTNVRHTLTSPLASLFGSSRNKQPTNMFRVVMTPAETKLSWLGSIPDITDTPNPCSWRERERGRERERERERGSYSALNMRWRVHLCCWSIFVDGMFGFEHILCFLSNDRKITSKIITIWCLHRVCGVYKKRDSLPWVPDTLAGKVCPHSLTHSPC